MMELLLIVVGVVFWHAPYVLRIDVGLIYLGLGREVESKINSL